MAFDKYRNVVVVCGNVFLHPTTIYVDVLVELSRMDAVSTLCDKRLVSYERKLTFTEIRFGPMMSRIARIVTASTQKMWFYCIEICSLLH